MNWKRIWTGTALAGLVFCVLDYFINGVLLKSVWQQVLFSGTIKALRPFYSLPIIDFGIGFILMWLYAAARSRLGPGPKTALWMGTLAWFLLYLPMTSAQWLWFQLPAKIPLTYLFAGLLQCWASIYVAGWQYIERSPD